MTPEREIGDIVEEFLRAARDGRAPSIDEVCARHPGHAAELRELLEAAASLEGARPPAPAGTAVPVRRLGRFRLLREIGRGGMGVVYEAIQEPLERRVALKVLPAARFANPSDLRRFEREAELAARLDDPGICTVYESGIEDGQAYIAMRFVEGETLSTRIDSTRKSSKDSTSTAVRLDEVTLDPRPGARAAASSDVQKAARLVARVARSLHEAHAKSLVHRDVKPGNIMITPAGDPVVLDFGLAHDDDADVMLTETGELCGTPAYMAPEQVQGQRAEIDARTDVYQLGVTLYECLTLRRPFEARVRAALYRAILQDEPDDPRRWNPEVDPDLSAITLRALEKDPRRRYASAEAFALDLEGYGRGDPVVARPISAVERLRRRVRAHPWRAAAIALLVLTVVGGPIGWSLQMSSKLDAVRAEEARTHTERVRADQGYERARATASRMIDRVREERFRGGAVSPELERDLLGQALRIYADFVEVNHDDPASRLDLCAAHAEIGDLHTQLRDLPAALDEFQRSIDLATAALPEPGAGDRARRLLANAHRLRGQAHRHLEQFDAAESDFVRSLALLEQPASTLEDADADARVRHSARRSLALSRLRTGDAAGGLAELQRMAAELDPILAREPPPVWALREAAMGHGEFVAALSDLGRMAEAEKESRAAVDLARRALAREPENVEVLEMAANQSSRAGGVAFQTGRVADAEAHFIDAVEIQERLAAMMPGSVDPVTGLGSYLKNLGLAQWYQDCAFQAEATWRRALELRERLWRAHPEVPRTQEDLAASLTDLAFLLRIDRPAQALELYRRAAGLGEMLFAASPDEPLRQAEFANMLSELGAAHARLGYQEDAAPYFDRALALRQDLVDRFPEVPDHRSDLGVALANLGEHENQLGHGPEAIALWERGFEQQLKAFDLNPQSPQYEMMLFGQGKQLAEGLLQTDAPERALEVVEAVSPRMRTRGDFHHLAAYYLALAHAALAEREPVDAALVARAREGCVRELGLAIDFGRTNVRVLVADEAFAQLRTEGALAQIEARLADKPR